MSRLQRQCRTACEEGTAGAAKSNPETYHDYVRTNAGLRKAVGGTKKYQEIRSIGSQEKADCMLIFFQVVFSRNQGMQGQALSPATLKVKMPDGVNTEKAVWGCLKKNGPVESDWA